MKIIPIIIVGSILIIIHYISFFIINLLYVAGFFV